jgi:hypothetical protein
MTPADFNAGPLSAAFALLPAAMDSVPARVEIIAICLQESGLIYRRQVGGPAVGLAQFERGGILGVLRHKASAWHALQLCNARGVAPNVDAVYAALPVDDVLAAGFARLLLWTDPYPLPVIGDEVGAWLLYFRCWRPGLPHRENWPSNYTRAREALSA